MLARSNLLVLLSISCSEGKGDVHCQIEKLSGTLPKFWGWLDDATYTGNTTYHEVVYDEWSANVRIALLDLCLAPCLAANFVLQLCSVNVSCGGVTLCMQVAGVELLLLVPKDDPNTPKFLRRRSGPTTTGLDFTMFSTTEPPPSDFVVPKVCSTAGRRST